MVTFADILDQLNADELRYIVDSYEIECDDRRRLVGLRQSILASNIDPSEILNALTVDELKWLCEAFEQPTSGRKAVLIERLLADGGDWEEVDVSGIAADVTIPEIELPPIPQSTGRAASVTTEKDNGSVELSIFRAWLQGGLNTGICNEGKINFSFCPACSRRHPRQWFEYADSTRSFYLCYAGEPIVVESLEIGARFTTHAPSTYVKANALNDRFSAEIERVENAGLDGQKLDLASEIEVLIAAAEAPPQRSLLSRLFGSSVEAGSHLVRNVRVSSITSTPPFVELKIDIEHVHAAIQKGRDSWGA